MDATTAEDTKSSGQPYDPRQFLTQLDQLSTSELGINFVYSALDLLAGQYRLSDAVVVIRDEALGPQAFRLGRKSVSAESLAPSATAPGVYCEPDVVPEVVRDVVRSVCQLALSLHMARFAAGRDPIAKVANRQYFDAALRTAAMQSSRYGWIFTLVLVDVDSGSDGEGHGDVMNRFGSILHHSVRSGDTAARIRQNEFAIILWNTEGSDVLAFTERLRSTLVPGAGPISFTIGTATSPRDTSDPVELLRIAQVRLSEKKGSVSS